MGLEDEVTRLGGVRYLQGLLGHATLTLLLFLVAGVFFGRGARGVSLIVVICAVGVVLNGVSLYLWNRLTRYFQETATRKTSEPDRTLGPPQVSPETKGVLSAGFVITSGFILASVTVYTLAQATSFRLVTYGVVGVVLVADVAILAKHLYVDLL